MTELNKLKELGEAPSFLTEEGFKTLSNGYLLPNETPKKMYERVSNAAASSLNKPELASKFFDIIWKNWLCLSTPIASNLGTNKGLPIACYASSVPDNTIGIFKGYTETAMLSKYGGGMGKFWGKIRPRGAPISKGGQSDGVVSWLKIEENVIQAVAQGATRRGASANYLPIEHDDSEEFIDIRRQTGDPSRRCLSNSFHHGVTIKDKFLQEALDGNVKNRELFNKLLKTRLEMGEPYIVFLDNVNRANPAAYKNNGLEVETSNLCSEITLYTDDKHTFVCCLSSMNLARFDEWKNTDAVNLSIKFLDAVMTEFLNKAKDIEGFENSVRFASKSRALGLGGLGWHSLLQKRMIPFDSFDAMQLNAEVFRTIKYQAEQASRELAEEYGEPEWCKGTGMRNSHLTTVAPTVSNALISGNLSQGIEPLISNMFSQKSAKGVFIQKNPMLQQLLMEKGLDTFETWQLINENGGSVRNVKGLSPEEKEVFLTAREINQFAIVRQAGQRQRFIDQSQSVNLFFAVPSDLNDNELRKKLGKYVFDVHMEAWQLGVKSLYYCRSESPLKGDSIYREASDCKSCEA